MKDDVWCGGQIEKKTGQIKNTGRLDGMLLERLRDCIRALCLNFVKR